MFFVALDLGTLSLNLILKQFQPEMWTKIKIIVVLGAFI